LNLVVVCITEVWKSHVQLVLLITFLLVKCAQIGFHGTMCMYKFRFKVQRDKMVYTWPDVPMAIGNSHVTPSFTSALYPTFRERSRWVQSGKKTFSPF